jgi:hypothetical protein
MLFTSIARRYQAWRRYEAVRRELSHLTDREWLTSVLAVLTSNGSLPGMRIGSRATTKHLSV